MIEAEPSLMEKMSQIDRLALARLNALAKDSLSYPSLMTLLTRDTMRGDPFIMDYKQGHYGFSVIKTQVAASYASQARNNNIKQHLPMTIVKQVVYDDEFRSILQEKISVYFNKCFHDKGFKKAIMDTTRKACEALHGSDHVSATRYEIEIMNVPHQTPRLLLAPLLEILVREHLRFYFSKSLEMYVSCGFYTQEQGDYAQFDEKPDTKTGISFEDVKALLYRKTETSFMSLPQYWKVYQECESFKDTVTLRSLRELLDTSIHRCSEVQNCDGRPIRPVIVEAKLALIRPQDINAKTGLPERLVSPDTYSNNNLWRGWSPDQTENVATQNHIFVMDQTCIDLKIGRKETT